MVSTWKIAPARVAVRLMAYAVASVSIMVPAAGTVHGDLASASPGPGRALAGMLSVGASSSCAITTNGVARCWGNNGSGQSGRAGVATVGDDETPASVWDSPHAARVGALLRPARAASPSAVTVSTAKPADCSAGHAMP